MAVQLEYRASSAFGDLRPNTFAVMSAPQNGDNIFVVVEQETMAPCGEFEHRDQAVGFADLLTMGEDLGFLVDRMPSKWDSGDVLYAGPDLTTSSDGLDLRPVLFSSTKRFAVDKVPVGWPLDEGMSAQAREMVMKCFQKWTDFRAKGPEVLSGPTETLAVVIPVSVVGEEMEREVVVAIGLQRDGAGVPTVNEIAVVDDKAVFGDTRVTLILGRFSFPSPIGLRTFVVAEQADLEWGGAKAFVDAEMPLFKDYLIRSGSDFAPCLAFEGGEVMRRLAAARPWMVEKGPNGEPLPLRVEAATLLNEANDETLDQQVRWLTALVIHDMATAEAKLRVAEQQKEVGITREQVIEGVGQFHQLANVGAGIDLEGLFVGVGPNAPGSGVAETRDWIGYRLWIEGELVLDAHPGVEGWNRRISLSPMRRRLDHRMILFDDQVGELLLVAVTEITDYDDDDQRPSERVQAFLRSSVADELGSVGHELEAGSSVIVDGRVVEAVCAEPSADDLSP